MANYTITLPGENKVITANEQETLLHALVREGCAVDAPCGGRGTCGKCLVKISSEKYNGLMKACTVVVDCDMVVDLSAAVTGHSLLTTGTRRKVPVEPMLKRVAFASRPCGVGERYSEWELLQSALHEATGIPAGEFTAALPVISGVYSFMKEHDHKGVALISGTEVLDLVTEETPTALAAFDIGTTSLVGYLLKADTGEEMAVTSRLNPQSRYGADVIARSDFVLTEDGGETMAEVVRHALNEMIGELAEQAQISREEIYQISVVGNTCMSHLLLKISPASLVHAPYNPAVRNSFILPAAQLDMEIHPQGQVLILPNIAGFVGADTVGCLLAADFDHREKMTLMIDIGTNGEMVLGNKDRMIACSTAAGPAFEGARISCGMRGAKGAIDHISMENGKMVYSTIGDVPAAGICGSGLMDLVAMLLEKGFIEDTGRLMDEDELESEEALANADRIVCIDGKNAFAMTDEVYLGQKDIGEVQQAKAAIAAGVILLAGKMGIEVEEIEEVLIAGAFGNYMKAKSACTIGLIPKELEGKITMIGNAAGEGAKMAVLSETEFARTADLIERVEFLELAADPDFNDTYIDELMFETEEDA